MHSIKIEYTLEFLEVLLYFGAEHWLVSEQQHAASPDDDAWHHEASTN